MRLKSLISASTLLALSTLSFSNQNTVYAAKAAHHVKAKDAKAAKAADKVNQNKASGVSSKQQAEDNYVDNQDALKAAEVNVESKLTVSPDSQKQALNGEKANITVKIAKAHQAAVKHKAEAKKPVPKKETAPKQDQNNSQNDTDNSVNTNTDAPVMPKKHVKDINSYGVDLNQTSGYINVDGISHYLADKKGIYPASKWAQIIMRESGGKVDAVNASSGAYGFLQLLGHGEYKGESVGDQLKMIMPLPASAWDETNY